MEGDSEHCNVKMPFTKVFDFLLGDFLVYFKRILNICLVVCLLKNVDKKLNNSKYRNRMILVTSTYVIREGIIRLLLVPPSRYKNTTFRHRLYNFGCFSFIANCRLLHFKTPSYLKKAQLRDGS